jgi:transcriptional regulator with XRE-family HTH domain
MTALGKRLLELRTACGLSQREVAERCGCCFTTICKFERGFLIPGPAMVERLAEALGAEPNELLLFAGHVPEEVVEQLRRCPAACRFLERTAGFSNGQWEALYRMMWGR